VDDAHVEGSETVRLRLRDVIGVAVVGTQSTATLTITDNDATAGAEPDLHDALLRQDALSRLPSREPEAGEPWSAILNGART
jgi:hypothetical protein